MGKWKFSMLNTTAEVVAMANKFEDRLNAQAGQIGSLQEQVKAQASQIGVAQDAPPKTKSKGGFARCGVLATLAVLAVILLAVPALATNRKATYNRVSNPQQLRALLQDWAEEFDDGWQLFRPQTTAPTAAEGKLYYNDTANALYVCTDGTTWSVITTAAGVSLDSAYDLGSKIDVDGTVLELEVDDGSNNSALLIDHDEATNDNDAMQITNAADSATAVSIQIDGTAGFDIQGTSDSWNISTAGLASLVGITNTAADCLWDDTYDLSWDTSRDQLLFEDNAVLGIGGAHDAAGDVTLTHDGTDFLLDAAIADEGFKIGTTTTGFDITYYWESAGTITTDYDGDVMVFDGGDLRFNDGDFAVFGDGSDWTIDSSTTKILDLTPATTDETSAIYVGADTAGADLKVFGATTGEYWLYDSSTDTITANTGNAAYTMTDAEADQFKVDATGTAAGNAINFETTDGGILLNADGAANGDIGLNAADDMTLTTGGNLTLAVTGTVSAGGSAITNVASTVTPDIDDRSINATESGAVFTIPADADGSVFTLPTAAAGLTFTFCDTEEAAGADLCIKAGASDTISDGDAAAYYNCYDDTFGSSVTLLAVDAEQWVVVSSVGTWTADSDTTAP